MCFRTPEKKHNCEKDPYISKHPYPTHSVENGMRYSDDPQQHAKASPTTTPPAPHKVHGHLGYFQWHSQLERGLLSHLDQQSRPSPHLPSISSCRKVFADLFFRKGIPYGTETQQNRMALGYIRHLFGGTILRRSSCMRHPAAWRMHAFSLPAAALRSLAPSKRERTCIFLYHQNVPRHHQKYVSLGVHARQSSLPA